MLTIQIYLYAQQSMHSPLLLDSYHPTIKVACVQRTGELIISTIIDPEILRIKKLLLWELYTFYETEEEFSHYRLSILQKEHEEDALKEYKKIEDDGLKFLHNPGDISDDLRKTIENDLRKNREILYPLEIDTELNIIRVKYYDYLEIIKESIRYVIENPHLAQHLVTTRKYKHSSNIWLHIYGKFVIKHHVASYEAIDEIRSRLEAIRTDIDDFKQHS